MLTVAERVDLSVLKQLYKEPHTAFDLVVAAVHNGHMVYEWTDARMHIIGMQDRGLIVFDYTKLQDGRPTTVRLTLEGLAVLARLEDGWPT